MNSRPCVVRKSIQLEDGLGALSVRKCNAAGVIETVELSLAGECPAGSLGSRREELPLLISPPLSAERIMLRNSKSWVQRTRQLETLQE